MRRSLRAQREAVVPGPAATCSRLLLRSWTCNLLTVPEMYTCHEHSSMKFVVGTEAKFRSTSLQQSSQSHTSTSSYLLCRSLSTLLPGQLRADAVQQRSDKHYPPLFTVGALTNCVTLPGCSTARGKSDGLCSCRASAHTAST